MLYSRFFLVDLQVHTPADPQQAFGNWGGKAPSLCESKTKERIRPKVTILFPDRFPGAPTTSAAARKFCSRTDAPWFKWRFLYELANTSCVPD